EPLAQGRVWRGERLLHLRDELRLCPDRGGVAEPAPHTLVRGVGERAPPAGACLHDHLVTALDELASTGRCKRDPVLVRLDLLDDADFHGRETLACGGFADCESVQCEVTHSSRSHDRDARLSRLRSQRGGGWWPPGRQARNRVARRVADLGDEASGQAPGSEGGGEEPWLLVGPAAHVRER